MKEGRPSRTAVLVCQGRAAADARYAVGRFGDPVAITLLTAGERVPVEQVRAGTPPRDWRDRMAYEAVRASAELLVPRTVAIDDAIRTHPAPQVVILGAGLDSRAWRMPELRGARVFEVDHPASQLDKEARISGHEPLTEVLFVPVDFTSAEQSLTRALAAAGHEPWTPTTWVWEGVIPYLRRSEVADTLGHVEALSARGSRLIVNYQSPASAARAGRVAALLLAGRRSALAGEPWRSLWRPAQIAALVRGHGFTVTADDDLLTLAGRLETPTNAGRSWRSGRVAVADR